MHRSCEHQLGEQDGCSIESRKTSCFTETSLLSPCAVFAANRGYALMSSRRLLIEELLASDWTVVLATEDDEESRELCSMGARLEPVSFHRGGLSFMADIQAYRTLASIYRQWKPSLVHHFHAKPVVLGPLAARRACGASVRIINVITGLGFAFNKNGLSSAFAGLGYHLSLPRSDVTIFQNPDDRDFFLEKGWVTDANSRLIVSSGVDLDRFTRTAHRPRSDPRPTVVMLSRLLRRKGVPSFIEVAKRIQSEWPNVRFVIAGEEDPGHPDAVPKEELTSQPAVEYLGRLGDVVPLLSEADIFLFPSSYREGVPRAILEASAMGIPTVGYDIPGVREAVRDGESGYLVPDEDRDALTDRTKTLLALPELCKSMGMAARRLAETCFDIRAITAKYLEAYRDIGIHLHNKKRSCLMR